LGVDPHVSAGIERAASWLSDSGYDVVEAEPPNIAEVAQLWFDAIWADVGAMWPGIAPIAGASELEFVEACVSSGVLRHTDQSAQREAWMAIAEHAAQWNAFLAQYPVILSPVCCERPWTVGDDVTRITEIAKAMRMVVPVNILGLASCAVPVGADEGLPQGVQLIGARFSEMTLLDAAEQIELRAPSLSPEMAMAQLTA
jgi:amidase